MAGGAADMKGEGGRGRSGSPGPTHVARLEFPRETGLILRCAGKAGNPFQYNGTPRIPSQQDERPVSRSDPLEIAQIPRLNSTGALTPLGQFERISRFSRVQLCATP